MSNFKIFAKNYFDEIANSKDYSELHQGVDWVEKFGEDKNWTVFGKKYWHYKDITNKDE